MASSLESGLQTLYKKPFCCISGLQELLYRLYFLPTTGNSSVQTWFIYFPNSLPHNHVLPPSWSFGLIFPLDQGPGCVLQPCLICCSLASLTEALQPTLPGPGLRSHLSRRIRLTAQPLLGARPLTEPRAKCCISITSCYPTAILSNKLGSFFLIFRWGKKAKVTCPRLCDYEVAQPGFKFISVSEAGRTHR